MIINNSVLRSYKRIAFKKSNCHREQLLSEERTQSFHAHRRIMLGYKITLKEEDKNRKTTRNPETIGLRW